MKYATTQTKLYAETAFVMLAIVDSVVAALILFKAVHVSQQFSNWVAAIALAYAIVAFAEMAHRSVKQKENR